LLAALPLHVFEDSCMPFEINQSSVDRLVRDEDHPETCPADRVSHLDVEVQRLAFVERICLTLFDRWCQQRNVLALAYLMYGWPLTGNDPSLVRRLLRSLLELREFHHEELLSEEVALLSSLLDFERLLIPV
jgi:hypothetical protein